MMDDRRKYLVLKLELEGAHLTDDELESFLKIFDDQEEEAFRMVRESVVGRAPGTHFAFSYTPRKVYHNEKT